MNRSAQAPNSAALLAPAAQSRKQIRLKAQRRAGVVARAGEAGGSESTIYKGVLPQLAGAFAEPCKALCCSS